MIHLRRTSGRRPRRRLIASVAALAAASLAGTGGYAELTSTATVRTGAFGVDPEPAVPEQPRLEGVLGGAQRIAGGHDEFRADFVLRVPHRQRPLRLEYQLYPARETPWVPLFPVGDIQQKIDQNYQIVKVVPEGLTDLLVISARGDGIWNDDGTTRTVRQRMRVTLPSDTVEFSYDVELQSRRDNKGRPVAVNAWDNQGNGLPGHVGPNGQMGWGNTAPAGGTVPGGRFIVDAINSGRQPIAGCDVTDEVYYQFVNELGVPASVTPTPRSIKIRNHEDGIAGATLASLGDITFDAPGYYRLLVWPQARSSYGMPADCSAVSWDPSDPAQGTQLGSVFYDYTPTGPSLRRLRAASGSAPQPRKAPGAEQTPETTAEPEQTPETTAEPEQTPGTTAEPEQTPGRSPDPSPGGTSEAGPRSTFTPAPEPPAPEPPAASSVTPEAPSSPPAPSPSTSTSPSPEARREARPARPGQSSISPSS